MKYSEFIFENYDFNKNTKELTLNYSLDGVLNFTEKFTFNFAFKDYDPDFLEKAIRHLFFIAGVSYYKTYAPKNIVIKGSEISKIDAEFYSKTYQKGLGEFYYVNGMNPKEKIHFPHKVELDTPKIQRENNSGFLVAVGGGKDSITSIDLLEKSGFTDIETWSLSHEVQLNPLVMQIGKPHNPVRRQIDPKLLKPEQLPDSLNGHIPISAIFACVGTVVSILRGKRDVVMSNERSADEETLTYKDTTINHQYSKSSEFEKDYQKIVESSFGDNIRYYSILRPLSEIQIARYFVENCFERYKDVFSSCNRAFVHGSNKLYWDASCSKCAFVYLVFSPFLPTEKLNNLIGKNMLLDIELEPLYRQLLGLSSGKPLECVGEIRESRWAMTKAQNMLPELQKYVFDPVPDSDIFKLETHSIPPEIYEKINFELFLKQN